MSENKVFYTVKEMLLENGELDSNDITIRTDDGGVATIHHNEDHFVTTYYQSRDSDFEVDWDELAEGKAYHKDWDKDKYDSIDDEMIEDALRWLVVGDCQFIQTESHDIDSAEGRGDYRDGEPAYEQTSEVK
jgi:hypothetical protein